MPADSTDRTLAGGGRSNRGPRKFNPDIAYYVGDDFYKLRQARALEENGFKVPENIEDRKYKVVRTIVKDVPTIEVWVLYEHITRKKFMEQLRESGKEPDPYARTTWAKDVELTKKFLEQCDYVHPNKAKIELLPNGKFECHAEYSIDGKPFPVRLDEIERRPTNINLDPASYEQAIIEQLCSAKDGIIGQSYGRRC